MALAATKTSRIRLGTGGLVPTNRIAPAAALPPTDLATAMRVNLEAPMALSCAELPLLRRRGADRSA